MPSKKPQLKTYTTNTIIEKFAYIAEKENRSMSKQLEYIVKREIDNYEKENGIIETTKTE
jgi:hypothetical protein